MASFSGRLEPSGQRLQPSEVIVILIKKRWLGGIPLVLGVVLLVMLFFNLSVSAHLPEPIASGASTSTPTKTSTPTSTPTVTPYWKEGDWVDYAPNGMPDFDQRQDEWQCPGTQTWTYCGPLAVANCLWWFDSKMDPHPVPPPAINDNYPLVQSYPPYMWDDHDPWNLPPFVEDLALLMDTDGWRTGMPHLGTYVWDMHAAINEYLARQGLADYYEVTMVHKPTFEWVAYEVERCEGVILLLGFWTWHPEVGWRRKGGHFVTIAGVGSHNRLIFFSDPIRDRAEAGWPGRFLPPWSHDHPLDPPDTVHNDAQHLSHDMYHVVETERPDGNWGPADYYESLEAIEAFAGQNFPRDFPQELKLSPGAYRGGEIQTEVEYAIAISPAHTLYLPMIMKSHAQ